ncbi:MAG: glycogen debranching protein GlgX [Pseudomonadota bacterium]
METPERLGAHIVHDGVQFAVYAPAAQRVDLCLFDAEDRLTDVLTLPHQDDGIWHGWVSGCQAGQRYGYRAFGRWAPEEGLRFDATKLLIDPYARQLSGPLIWCDALFSSAVSAAAAPDHPRFNSAHAVPKGVVLPEVGATRPRPSVPWRDTVIYEGSVRGLTMRHPDVPELDRGRFRGLTCGAVLKHIRSLGISSIELLPVHFFADEQFLTQRGLRNYWGYNTLSFFAPMNRYAGEHPVADLIDMIDTIHDAGLEVILDVVYNHTAEGNEHGPTLSFRGLNNTGYYRLPDDRPEHYINDTGCGNTLDINDAGTQRLVLDSLRYFANDLQIDGFRFDLAPILGRRPDGFTPDHPFFNAIANDPVLSSRKLIAEPWDVGPGGYQLGQFPPPWAHWNDQFRDATRCFWRGDRRITAQFARRLHGSADLFERGGGGPFSGINFVTAHDGFTLMDTVSYRDKHNHANGEDNRDGHNHNCSDNCGIEGATDDTKIVALRQRQRLNLMASVLFAQGVPMLLAGDEFGHTQNGNNNAYAQDNETTWLDWSKSVEEQPFTQAVRELIALRRDVALLRGTTFRHGEPITAGGLPNIDWLRPDGQALADHEWFHTHAFTLLIRGAGEEPDGVVILFNATAHSVDFALPAMGGDGTWSLRFYSDLERATEVANDVIEAGANTCALLTHSP